MLEQVTLVKTNRTLDFKEDLGVTVLGIRRDAPNLVPQYVSFEWGDGSRYVGSSFKSFNLTLSLYLKSESLEDFELRLDVFLKEIYVRGEYFLIRSREPGKRYRVRPQPFSYSKVNQRNGTIELEFEAYEGHSESLATTLEIDGLESGLWQFGQGLPLEDYAYEHRNSHFFIYNAGDFTVDPREHYLKIMLKGMSEGNIDIFNQTTGERFVHYGSLYSDRGEVLTLEGVYPYKNGVNCGINTNGGLISLAPGENEIKISNISRVEASFDFRFLYK